MRQTIQKRKKVVGVFCSDVHLSHRPPVARSAEKCWYSAMGRQLDELRSIAVEHDAPIFIAGDIFDRWNPPPELINFAIRSLPKCHAIPGQHDLPFHNYQDIKKSAYWTLVESGVISNLPPDSATSIGSLVLHSFPWGRSLTPCPTPHLSMLGLNVALIHCYVWSKGAGYPNAPQEKHVKCLRKIFETYDAVFTGDNHLQWSRDNTWNCGGFFRRKSDEIDSTPAVYLLDSKGGVEKRNLDVSKDKFLTKTELEKFEREVLSCGGFVEELSSLEDSAIDFRDGMKKYMDENRVSKGVREWILKACEE